MASALPPVPPPSDSLKLEAFTVCEDDCDLLTYVYENVQHFDRWIIVVDESELRKTDLPQDARIEYRTKQELIEECNSHGGILGQIKVASHLLRTADWIVLLAPGVLLPRFFRRRIAAQRLQGTCVYTTESRKLCSSVDLFISIKGSEPWNEFQELDLQADSYFRMFQPARLSDLLNSITAAEHSTNDVPLRLKRPLPMSVLQIEHGTICLQRGITESNPKVTESHTVVERALSRLQDSRGGAAVLGYFPGGLWKEVAKYFDRTYVVDRYQIHTKSFVEARDRDREELQRIFAEESADSVNLLVCNTHKHQWFDSIPTESLSALYIPGVLTTLSLWRLLLKWAPKMKSGSIIFGDSFGYQISPDYARAVSLLLGTPNFVDERGCWSKLFEPEDGWSVGRQTERSKKDKDTLVYFLRFSNQIGALIVSLCSARKHWSGEIHVIYWGAEDELLRIACIQHDARLKLMPHSPPTEETSVAELFRAFGGQMVSDKTVLLESGVLLLSSLEHLLNQADAEGACRATDAAIITRNGDIYSVHPEPAHIYTRDRVTAGLLNCRGRSDYWTEDAWERWSECEADAIARLSPDIRIPLDVCVVTVVAREQLGDFQRNWLTWRFASCTQVVIIFAGVTLEEFWLPGDRAPTNILTVSEQHTRDIRHIARLAVDVCTAKRLLFLPPNATALAGADLATGRKWEDSEILFGRMGTSETAQIAAETNNCADLFVLVSKAELVRRLDESRRESREETLAELLTDTDNVQRTHKVIDLQDSGWRSSISTGDQAGVPERQTESIKISVAINVSRESVRQIKECLERIAVNLPRAEVAVFLDGVVRPEIEKLAHNHGFHCIPGENLGNNSDWNRWWIRMLTFFVYSNADVCFKFDPDTMVDARPVLIPTADYFGQVCGDFVQGGVTGLSRSAVRRLLEFRLLERVPGRQRPWLEEPRTQEFMDDQLIARALAHIGIFPSRWTECRSEWRDPVLNRPLNHAIVHPRYYTDKPLRSSELRPGTSDEDGLSSKYGIVVKQGNSPANHKLRKTLVYACDHRYFDYTLSSLASFMEHHNSSVWEVICVDVGMTESQRQKLEGFARIIAAERCTAVQQHGIVYPSGRARVKILSDIVFEDTVMVYMDSDTLVFGSIEEILESFIQSGRAIAVAYEDDPNFGCPEMSYAWKDGVIPLVFQNQARWRHATMLNTGVLFARGEMARKIGVDGVQIYDQHTDRIRLAEQTVIASLIYEYEIPVFRLPIKYNCFVWEKALTHASPPEYASCAPFYGGVPVVVRHFCGYDAKGALDGVIRMRQHSESNGHAQGLGDTCEDTIVASTSGGRASLLFTCRLLGGDGEPNEKGVGHGLGDHLGQLTTLYAIGCSLGWIYVHSPFRSFWCPGFDATDYLGLAIGEQTIGDVAEPRFLDISFAEALSLLDGDNVLLRKLSNRACDHGSIIRINATWDIYRHINHPRRNGWSFRLCEKFNARHGNRACTITPFQTDKVKIAVHVRRGDCSWFPWNGEAVFAWSHKVVGLDSKDEDLDRAIPLSFYTEVFDVLFAEFGADNFEVRVYSDGHLSKPLIRSSKISNEEFLEQVAVLESEFETLSSLWPHLSVQVGTSRALMEETIAAFACADIAVIGRRGKLYVRGGSFPDIIAGESQIRILPELEKSMWLPEVSSLFWRVARSSKERGFSASQG